MSDFALSDVAELIANNSDLVDFGSAENAVYSIYGIDFKDVCGGDIVYQNLTDVKNGKAKEKQLVVGETDFGEIFYFDYSQLKEEECPIF
ncbi:hypothetical protein PANTOEA_11770 (plasmid) [Pantoea dispersa]|uniref:hypothetical protein n=1 Tax=Pantoea dispersa TaxID=59814 RepID=UPI0032B5A254